MGDSGALTGVTQSGTEEVEEVQRVVKYSSLSSYMLKPPSLLTQVFNKNKKSQNNLFNHMCNFGAREWWSIMIIAINSYLDVGIRKDQDHLLNPCPFGTTKGYITEYYVGANSLKKSFRKSRT